MEQDSSCKANVFSVHFMCTLWRYMGESEYSSTYS